MAEQEKNMSGGTGAEMSMTMGQKQNRETLSGQTEQEWLGTNLAISATITSPIHQTTGLYMPIAIHLWLPLTCFRLYSWACYHFKFTRDKFKLIFYSFSNNPHQ